MRVNSINSYTRYHSTGIHNLKQKNVSFDGKHGCAKLFGGVMGTLGTLGAIGGTIIMTGGVALPFVLGYGAACAAGGAFLGHQIDKNDENSDKNKK